MPRPAATKAEGGSWDNSQRASFNTKAEQSTEGVEWLVHYNNSSLNRSIVTTNRSTFARKNRVTKRIEDDRHSVDDSCALEHKQLAGLVGTVAASPPFRSTPTEGHYRRHGKREVTYLRCVREILEGNEKFSAG